MFPKGPGGSGGSTMPLARAIAGGNGPLFENAIGAAPKPHAPNIVLNAADQTWLTKDSGRDDEDRLFYRMMLARESLIFETERLFRLLAGRLGWDERTTDAAAGLLLPLHDICERSCYTYYGHQHRTMLYSEITLEAHGTPEAERPGILLGSLIHDIGKAAVPGATLRKVGRHTAQEKKCVNGHPGYGKDILAEAENRLTNAGICVPKGWDLLSDIAFSHQEKYGGTGYPRGIAGTGISFGARVVGFCDSLDAMTSVRTYNLEPRTFAGAKTEARTMAGHFNMGIVESFLRAAETDAGLRSRIYEIILSGGGNPE
jgi:HD-GYP domain-containing protein (c-di-GMP phosphodiesterase class II)